MILAIGSDPKTLPFTGHEVIPIETALHPEKLAKAVSPNDTIAVFGSSHSAILVLANLTALKAKIINFYRTGLIAPGLFGLGVAFPQAKLTRLGHLEHLVGLWKFMDYLNLIMPIWLQD